MDRLRRVVEPRSGSQPEDEQLCHAIYLDRYIRGNIHVQYVWKYTRKILSPYEFLVRNVLELVEQRHTPEGMRIYLHMANSSLPLNT